MAKQLDYHTIREIFTRFHEAEAEPEGELEHVNVYTLVVAVALSAQATDIGVNKATRALFAIADTPQKMLDLGLDVVTDHIKTIGLFRVARCYNLSESLVVDRSRLRLVYKAGRREFAATCAADAAFVARIEAWPEEQLRSAQDLLGEHDQQLVSNERLRRNADKVWRAVVARQEETKRKRDEEYAAAAPARAA